jgi:predicted DNA binding protein
MERMVDATLPTEQFALRDTFDRVPDAEFEVVRVVAQEHGRVLPFLWAWSSDADALHAALEDDPTTVDVHRLSRSEDPSLYRVIWQMQVRAVVNVLVEERGTLLTADGSGDRWTFRLLFPDHDAVSATYECCREYGIDLTLRRVQDMTDSIGPEGSGLSEEQHEAIATAFETDYYGVPRGVTLEELAQKLDVSHQALSERLRRGHQNLISNTLGDARTSNGHRT